MELVNRIHRYIIHHPRAHVSDWTTGTVLYCENEGGQTTIQILRRKPCYHSVTKGELGPAQYNIDPPGRRLLIWIAEEAFRTLSKMWEFSRRGLGGLVRGISLHVFPEGEYFLIV